MGFRERFSFISRAHWLFVIFATIFGVLFVSTTPPLWGTDETSHFARVYQLAHGEIIPEKNKTNTGSQIPENLNTLIRYTKDDLLDNKPTGTLNGKEVNSTQKYQELTNQKFSNTKAIYNEMASYSPLAYPGAIVGMVLSRIFHGTIANAIFMARLFSLFVYIILVGASIKILANTRVKWLFFTVALLPVCVYQASVVTADNAVIAASILFMALLLRLLIVDKEQKSRRSLIALLILCAIWLPLIKLNYIFLSFSLLLLPTKYFETKNKALLVKSIGLTITIAAAVVWSKLSQLTANATSSQRPDGKSIDVYQQIGYTIHHPLNFFIDIIHSTVAYADSYTHSALTLIGWNYSTSPLIFSIILGCLLVIGALFARGEVAKLRPKLLIISLLSCVGIISIFAVMYFVFNPVASTIIEGVQGRYFLPFLIPLILTVILYIPIKLEIKEKYTPYIFSVPTLVCLIASFSYYILALY